MSQIAEIAEAHEKNPKSMAIDEVVYNLKRISRIKPVT